MIRDYGIRPRRVPALLGRCLTKLKLKQSKYRFKKPARAYIVAVDLDTVTSLGHSLRVCAMSTAEESFVVFHPMSNDSTSAVEACRGECLNCTLKAIEGIGVTLVDDVE